MESRRVGSYELIEILGRGATGQVWHAVTAAGEPVAMKLLRSELADDPQIVHGFIAERSLLLQVQGDSVTRVRDLVAEGGELGIVMELIPGGSVRELLDRAGTLAPSAACDLAAQVADGVALLHRSGIVHRDLKPENVLLMLDEPPWQPKITDFGISRTLTRAGTSARSTALVGTPAYIAPELLAGAAPGPSCDVYALGVMIYELLCGVTPFAHEQPLTVMRRALDYLPGRPGGLDDRLWAVICGCLDKSPRQRPDAAQVAAQLRAVAPQVLGSPPPPVLRQPPPGEPLPVSHAATQISPRPAAGVPSVRGQVATPRPRPARPTQPARAANSRSRTTGPPANRQAVRVTGPPRGRTTGPPRGRTTGGAAWPVSGRAPVRPPRSRSTTIWMVVVLLAVIGALSGLWAWILLRPTPSADASAGAVVVTSTANVGQEAITPRGTPTATTSSIGSDLPRVAATIVSDDEAVARLQQMRQQALASSPFDGSWGAIVSSQYVGVKDPTVQSGKAFSNGDIFRLAKAFHDDSTYNGAGNGVITVLQGDYANQEPSSHGDLWMTIVRLEGSSKDAANRWCQQTYSAAMVTHRCVPTQLSPNGGE